IMPQARMAVCAVSKSTTAALAGRGNVVGSRAVMIATSATMRMISSCCRSVAMRKSRDLRGLPPFSGASPGAPFFNVVSVLMNHRRGGLSGGRGGKLENGDLGGSGGVESARHAPLRHDDDAMRKREHFRQV